MLETDGRGTGIRPFPRIGSITLEGGGRGGKKNIFSLVSRQFSTFGAGCVVFRYSDRLLSIGGKRGRRRKFETRAFP